ncbi:hypothetical protein PR202_gb24732 [Eleusine coracana subsp. coracana]|uniref:DUF6598 domain-containing protein n=1 Tax=Eleusine coracana subsp. coracana TaxID=191504 RepID=A0AAV5FMA3_ELECO|nr:hypothetical protein PR202_gb24732 [Eleusine coracana subsp. coracana]
MATSRGVKSEELGSTDKRSLFPSAIDPISVRLANGEDDERKSMDAIHGDKDATRTTVESSDCKQDTREGSLIEMTGPKRGIDFSCDILIEYDMRIKTGDREEDNLQLIDGVEVIDILIISYKPVTKRIHGKYGALDMNQMCLKITLSFLQSGKSWMFQSNNKHGVGLNFGEGFLVNFA